MKESHAMETEERIQQEMFETRASLAEKLETLEQKVTGTVEQVACVVDDTVEVIKGTVAEAKATVSAVNESVQEGVKSVQESLDISKQVQAHPWCMVAGSVAAGFCLASVLPRGHAEPSRSSLAAALPPPSNGVGAHAQHWEDRTQAAQPSSEKSVWAPEIDKLKGLALGALFGAAREMIASSVPGALGQQLKEVIDNVTRKAGGEPIPSSAFAGLLQPRPTYSNRAPAQEEWRRASP